MKSLFAAILLLFAFSYSVRAQDTTRTQDSLLEKRITFSKVEVEAEYPGGKMKWLRFLNKHLRYPQDAITHNIQGTVWVQFIVDQQGDISDVQAFAGPTQGGLREEAVRLIATSGKWMPGTQNGHQVRSYKKMPIVFQLAN